MANYKLTLEIFYRDMSRRKTGKLTAADDLDAAMKALLLQANMGEKLDAEDHEELDSYIQEELSKNKLYRKQPLKAMQALADYNSEEINIRLVGPSGAVLLDTFHGENEEGADFDESGKPASVRARVQEEYELTTHQLERIAASSGYNPMTFLDAKRIGYRNGNPLYLLLSYDNDEDEYIVGKAEISRGKDAMSRIDFDGSPDFFSASRVEAYDAFHTLADGGKLTEGKYAAGGKHAERGWPEEDVNQRLAQKHGMDKNTIEKIRTRESSGKITWSSFDTPESNALEEKYLPANGDGDTMASQAVTAASRLIYKWFNNGDVYDNSYGLSGWANDISGSANWLAKHVPGARDILWRIQKTHSEEEYVSNILWPLFNLVYDSKLLSSLEKKPKVDDAYSCKGPFEFNYEDEDAYQEDFEESKKTSIGNLLREAAKPVQADKLGAWYKSAFTNDRKATENKEVYQVRESRVAKKPRVKESVPNWYEFQSDVFNAINEVYEKYNMGNAAEKIDKMDMIKVLTEWISMVTETKKASNSYKYNH